MLSFLLAGPFLLAQATFIPSSQQIDQLCKEALLQWEAPGLAAAIVYQDRVFYLKGFGVRSHSTREPVTPDTVFPLASCTKAFTTLAAARLVDQGKLRWDDPLRKYLPKFELVDPWVRDHVALRDVFCHRTGMGTHDFLWYRASWDLDRRLNMLGKLELKYPFRTRFEYQTTLFGAGGLAVGKAHGTSWSQAIKDLVLDPLEMTASEPTWHNRLGDQAAEPHRRLEDQVREIPRYPLEHPDPAGSLHSTARDLARFLRFQLGDGTVGGQKIMGVQALREPHRPQMIIPREGFARTMNPETVQLSYGLGWVVQDYRGHGLVLHGGAIDGFRSQLLLVPEARLGIALCNNLDGTYLNLALALQLVDGFLGLPGRDWNGFFQNALKEEAAALERAKKAFWEKRTKSTRPSRPLTDFAGRYEDPAYGPAEIQLANGQLYWVWAHVRCPLEHYEGDTFVGNSELLVNAPFRFRVNSQGRVEAVEAMDRVFFRR